MEFDCKFCGKGFERGYSLGGHITKCSKNPNRTNKFVSLSVRKQISKSLTGRTRPPTSEEQKKKISKTMKRLSREGLLKGWAINSDKEHRSVAEKQFIRI